MSGNMVDVMLHIDESTSQLDRENLRDRILLKDGVVAAAYHDDKPHLMVVEYDPDIIKSNEFTKIASESGLHAELIGM